MIEPTVPDVLIVSPPGPATVPEKRVTKASPGRRGSSWADNGALCIKPTMGRTVQPITIADRKHSCGKDIRSPLHKLARIKMLYLVSVRTRKIRISTAAVAL